MAAVEAAEELAFDVVEEEASDAEADARSEEEDEDGVPAQGSDPVS